MGTSWGKNTRIEVYDFEGETWRRAVVLQPDYDIGGVLYLQVGLVDGGNALQQELWIAPELVERHVRAAPP